MFSFKLCLGVNNIIELKEIEVGFSSDIAQGIKAVINRILVKMPNTKILLLGILPVPDPFNKIVKATNALISKFNDDKHVFYLDMSNSFLDSYRNQKEDLFDDTVHLSSLGYQVWYETMESFLQKLLK